MGYGALITIFVMVGLVVVYRYAYTAHKLLMR